MKTPEQLRKLATKAKARADVAYTQRQGIADRIPMGQPILVGHHSEGRHRRDIARMDRSMQRAIDETEKAESYERRARFHEYRQSQLEHAEAFSDAVEGHFDVGEVVTARFTNCNRFHSFSGEIVGRTKNDWKVKSLESFREDEPAGRVFYIPTASSRKHSQNNCIEKVVRMKPPSLHHPSLRSLSEVQEEREAATGRCIHCGSDGGHEDSDCPELEFAHINASIDAAIAAYGRGDDER